MNTRALIVALTVFLLAVIGAWAVSAQVQVRPAPQNPLSVQPTEVLSGSDIGFQIEGRRGDTAVGKLVVRVDGKRIDAQFAGSVTKITTVR
jgi:hypothetical protein